MLTPRRIVHKGVRAWKRIVYPWYVRWPKFVPRPKPRFRLYCVGLGKTGTHSIAAVFRKRCRADHEVGSEMDIRMVRAMLRGETPPYDPAEYVRRRDRYLRLEVDSNQLLRFFVEPLLSGFPDARFLLTIRDCYSWLDSALNHDTGRRISPGWLSIRDLTMNPGGLAHTARDRALESRGLPPLKACLESWERANRLVMDTVPPDRLLVVRTDRLPDSLARIEEFAGLPPGSADTRGAHAFRARKRFRLLEEVDEEYLLDTAERCCGDLMREIFPEVGHPRDTIREWGSGPVATGPG